MANSMTGFGCGEARKELVCIAVEIRSVIIDSVTFESACRKQSLP